MQREQSRYQPKVLMFTYGPAVDLHGYAIAWRPDGAPHFVDDARTHHDAKVTLKGAARCA